MADAWRVAERLLAGVVVGLAVGLILAWIGLGVSSLVLDLHGPAPGRLPRRPAPAAPFAPGHGRSFAPPLLEVPTSGASLSR